MYQELMGGQPPEGEPQPGMEGQGQQLTPEQMAALQQQQQMQPGDQMPGIQPGMEQPPANPEDEIEQARKLLGLDEYQQKMSLMEQKMQQLEAEKVAAQMQAKYPDVPQEAVEEEIKKIEAVNPEFAANMRTTEAGLEMAYRAALASIAPKETPDKFTDDSGSGGSGGGENVEELVKTGKADDFTLGNYILNAGS
jgi:hypothetical protein